MAKHQFLSALLRSYGEIGKIDPVGRALAHCYGHAMQTDPSLAKEILGKNVQEILHTKLDRDLWEVKVDSFRFKGRRNRRADIYIAHKNKPIAMIEIKVDDQDQNDEGKQLADYVKYCKANGLLFFYLTKNGIGYSEKRLLDQLKSKSLHRQHCAIRDALKRKHDSELAKMICGYLEDRGMHGYRPLSERKEDLLYFASRLLPVSGGFGRTHSKASINNMGQIVSKCLTNITTIGEWLRTGNESRFQRPFFVYPEVTPYWNLEKLVNVQVGKALRELKGRDKKDHSRLHKKLKQKLSREREIESTYSYGGDFNFSAEGYFAGTNLGLRVTIWIELDKEETPQLAHGLSAEFFGGALHKFRKDWKKYNGDKFHPSVWPWWDLNKSENETKQKLLNMLKEIQKMVRNLRNHPDRELKQLGDSRVVGRIASMTFPGLDA